jgi:hypothetical protein
MLAEKKNPFEVKGELVVPFRGVKIRGRPRRRNPRIIHQNVERAEFPVGPRHGNLYARLQGYVSVNDQSTPLAIKPLRHLVGAFIVDVKRYDRCSGFQETLCGAGAGCEGDFIAKRHEVESPATCSAFCSGTVRSLIY